MCGCGCMHAVCPPYCSQIKFRTFTLLPLCDQNVYFLWSPAERYGLRLRYVFATGPVSKPRSKIPRVVRTERPAPTHTCWVSSPEPAFCLPRRNPPLGRSFVKSCADLILAGGGVLAKVLYGGDFATSSNPEVGAGAQRRAPLWPVALHRQILHSVRRAAPSLAAPGPAPPCCQSSMAKTKLQICLGASTHGLAAACRA